MRHAKIITAASLLIFSCAELKETGSQDGNDDIRHAALLSAKPSTVNGFVDEASDEDYYRIHANANIKLHLDLSVPDGVNYDLYLINSQEVTLDSSIGIGTMESITYTISQSGSYYVRIASGDGTFSSGLPYRMTAYAADSSGGPGFNNPHLALGNPSKAVSSYDSTGNFLIARPQYALSFNSSAGRPNWVSWHLNAAWLGPVSRQEDFRSDDELPPSWYRVTENDFSGTGYDRGHMCPSGDRTATETDNSETFLMTNMVAQAPDNNQGPWADLENYCRELVANGAELFIVSGCYGINGTIAGGHISVPSRIWKVIVVLDQPESGISGVTSSTRVIAVDMPNANGIRSNNWKNYRITVDDIEAATGLDILSGVSPSVQSVIESGIDDQ